MKTFISADRTAESVLFTLVITALCGEKRKARSDAPSSKKAEIAELPALARRCAIVLSSPAERFSFKSYH